MVENLAWFILTLFAGAGVFLISFNRAFSYLQDGGYKFVKILMIFAGIMGGVGILSWLVGFWFPFALLAGMALGELHRLILRRRYRAESPVQMLGPKSSFFRPQTRTDLQVKFYRIQLPRLGLPKVRIAFLSDFHLNNRLPVDYYRNAVRSVNDTEPDLIFLGGDYFSGSPNIPQLKELFSGLGARLDVYAILGNHDYWSAPVEIQNAFEQIGIKMLSSAWCDIFLDQSSKIQLAGYDRPWGAAGAEPFATAKDPPAMVVAHTADGIYRLNRLGAKVVFSGHYHGGQFRIPGLGAIVVPSKYGRRFDAGHFLVRGTHLFVSGGVGADHPASRLYCPPDILIVDMIGDY